MADTKDLKSFLTKEVQVQVLLPALKIRWGKSRASSSLAIRIAELKGLRCNKTLFVWIIAFII